MRDVVSILLFSVLAFGKGISQEFDWIGLNVDSSEIVIAKDSFVMKEKGIVKGYWIWEVTKDDGRINFKDVSVLEGVVRESFDMIFEIEEAIVEYVDLDISTENFGLEAEITRKSAVDLRASYKMSGAQNRTKEIDTVYLESTVLRPEIFGMIPGLKDIEDVEKELNVYILGLAKVVDMQFRYLGSEMITVPFGTFTTDILLLEGNNVVSNKIYVSRTSPKRIIKVEVIGQDLSIERVN